MENQSDFKTSQAYYGKIVHSKIERVRSVSVPMSRRKMGEMVSGQTTLQIQTTIHKNPEMFTQGFAVTSLKHSYTATQTSTPWCLDFIDHDEAHVSGLICATSLVFGSRICCVLVPVIFPETSSHTYSVAMG